MRIYLLRHAIAAERDPQRWPDDRVRPLTDEGVLRMRKMARAMHALDLRFDRILTSPYERARHTAEIAAERFDGVPMSETMQLTPEGSFAGLIAELQACCEAQSSVLLVGHEPELGELACLLLTGRPGAWMPFKKAALACLEVEHLDPLHPRARLQWLLTAKIVRALG